MNFWNEMKKPIFCLAPMADVTDAAFRFIIAKYSKREPAKTSSSLSRAYVTYTEFVSADGLVLAPEEGKKKLLKDLEYSEIERPIVAQFFTSKPEMMEKAATLAVKLGFDGIDINMGCPDKSIEKQNAGASLIKNPKLARELIIAAKRGIQKGYKDDHCTRGECGVIKKEIPVSVKTRLGYNKDELEIWLPELLAENPAAIIIHARTRKDMSKVSARWQRIKRAVEIRDEVSKDTFKINQSQKVPFDTQKTLIIGNGDVADTDDGWRKCEESGADGAMLGRAIFGRPWLLSNSYEWFNRKNNPEVIRKILEILIEHTKLFEEKFKGIKNFVVMKKHFKAYLRDLDVGKELGTELMGARDANKAEGMIKNYLSAL